MLRSLAQRHRVTLLTYSLPEEKDKVAALEKLGIRVRTVPMPASCGHGKRQAQFASLFRYRSYQSASLHTARMQQAIDTLQAEQPFDLVQLESSQMATYRFATGTAIVLDEHNIEYELLQRMSVSEKGVQRRLYNTLEHLKFRREERQSWRRTDGCLLTSRREEGIVRQCAPHQRTLTAPNGVDIDYFRPSFAPPEPDTLVFTGLMSYRPNTDAAVYFVREILPHILRQRPHVVFAAVGMAPTEALCRLAGPHVVVTGQVEDVRPYVRRASVFVVPLRMGSGTRLKVLEGLAMGKPMVSTSLGCEGIPVCEGEHLLVADEPIVFAGSVLRLLENPRLAARLAHAGRAMVEQEYHWERIVEEVEAFHTKILEQRTAKTRQSPAFKSKPG